MRKNICKIFILTTFPLARKLTNKDILVKIIKILTWKFVSAMVLLVFETIDTILINFLGSEQEIFC